MKKILLPFVLSLFCLQGYAQISLDNPGFFHLATEYEFNMPQVELSLTLPANSGFKVPLLKGKNVFLDIDDKTYYYLDTEYFALTENNFFLFTSDSSESEYFALQIYSGIYAEDILDMVESGSVKREDIKPIKTSAGATISGKFTRENESPVHMHILANKEYSFIFVIPTTLDSQRIKIYGSIIAGLKFKKMPKELQEYNEKVDAGLFANRDEDEGVAESEGKELSKFEGVFDEVTEVILNKLNIGITIPKGWKYEINGSRLEYANGNAAHVEIDGSFLEASTMFFNMFRSDSLSMVLRAFTKYDLDVPESVQQQATANIYSKSIYINIDGMSVPAVFHGSKSSGAVETYFVIGDTKYWLSAYNVSLSTLPTLNRLFASIKLKGNISARKASNAKTDTPFALLSLEKEIEIPLIGKKVVLPDFDLNKAARCDFSGVGAVVYLPNGMQNYHCSLEGENIEITKGGVSEVPKDSSGKRLLLYSLADEIHYSFSLAEGQIFNVEYVENMVQGWSSYKDYSIINSAVQNINGVEWAVFVSKHSSGAYSGMFRALHGKYEVLATASGSSETEVYKKASALKALKFY